MTANSRLVLNHADVVTAHGVVPGGTVTLVGERIEAVGGAPAAGDRVVDLGGGVLLPGLINGHDHLAVTWRPRIGSGPYRNGYLYAEEAMASWTQRRRLTVADLTWLGIYRNLLSGVTVVLDHGPRQTNGFYDQFPLHCVTDFGRSFGLLAEGRWGAKHSALRWGEGIREELAAHPDRPFVIHAAHGVDHVAAREIAALDDLGALTPTTILAECVGCSDDDLRLIAQRGCHVAWLPASNRFVYGRVADVARMLELGINVCLAPGSSLPGGLNMLCELRTARDLLLDHYTAPEVSQLLLEMVTTRPAKALMLEADLGSIEPGKYADILALRPELGGGLDALLAADCEHVALLLRAGRPLYGDEAHRDLFEAADEPFSRVDVRGVPKLVAGDPAALMQRVRRGLGHDKDMPFIPIGM